jgi:hypothetical protein
MIIHFRPSENSFHFRAFNENDYPLPLSEANPQLNISFYTVNNTNIATARNLHLAFGGEDIS